MKEYVLDANAVLRYFKVGDAAGGDKVQELFLQAQRSQVRLCMSVVNLGEVFYILLRHIGEQRALHYVRVMQQAVTIVEADLRETIEAATLKRRCNLGYADSFAAALALERKATLVSADPGFECVGKFLNWIKLPRFEQASR